MRVFLLSEEVVVGRFSEAERVEVWDRWQAGETTRSIGRQLGRSGASIRAFVESTGGVRPHRRRRAQRHLSLFERGDQFLNVMLDSEPTDRTDQRGRARLFATPTAPGTGNMCGRRRRRRC